MRRHRAPGKPFAQLVFREAGKDWLCLTSNLQHAAGLEMGGKYSIEGVFKAIGEHHYIHEPDIAPLAKQIVKRRWWIAVTIGLVILLAAGGIVLAATHHEGQGYNSPDPTPQTPATDTNNSANSVPDTSSNDTAADPPTDATTPDTTANNPPAGGPPANTNNNNQGTPPPAPPAPTAPSAVGDLAAASSADGTGTSVTLSWTASTGATCYDIYRDGTKIGTCLGVGYTDSPTTPGTSYTYNIVAVDNVNNLSSGQSNTAPVTTDNPSP
ncbi:MAG TPA: hypothetical protein VLF40_01020 [Candidatus Saccharimonadales bacterium]|nr:hypothetical protein [Candidatus Saccharimonadales bacterium]